VNLDPDKLVVLFVIALLVLGPKRLPEVARTAGRWMAEVRKYTSALQGELHGVLGEPLAQTTALRDEFRSALAEPRAALEVGAREVRSSFDVGPPAAGDSLPPAGADDLFPAAGDSLPPATGASAPLEAARVPPQAVPDDPGLN
jgi:sec-independent protein translocase protein TatB